MTIMVSELYDALRDAGASHEKARKAAEVMVNYDYRFNRPERQIDERAGGMPAARCGVVITDSSWTPRTTYPFPRVESAMDGLIREMRILKWMTGATLVLTYLIFLRTFGII